MGHFRAWLSRVERGWSSSTSALHLRWDISLWCCSRMSILSSLTPDFGMHWNLSSILQFFPSWGNGSSSLISSANVHKGRKSFDALHTSLCSHLHFDFGLLIPYHLIRSSLSFYLTFLVFSRWTFSNHCNITKNETKANVFHIILLSYYLINAKSVSPSSHKINAKQILKFDEIPSY